MTNAASDPEAEFQNELRVFDNDVDEVIQCFYIWRTVHAAARKSRRVYDLLNRNAGFWVVALGSIQANSLIALGRIFDRGKDTHNVGRLLRLAAKNPAIFSKAALRRRKEKDLANASHLVDDFMKDVKEPTTSDFKRLEQFVETRRKVYEKCYKHLRDKRYAHKQRMDMSGIFAQTNTRELGRLVTNLSKLHHVLWHWYRNGVTPRTSRLRGTAGKEIQKKTLKFLRSLLAK
jgi:hypothetical protein